MNFSTAFSQRRFAANKGGFRLPSADDIRSTSRTTAFEAWADEVLSVKTNDHISRLEDMRVVMGHEDGQSYLGIRDPHDINGGLTMPIDMESRFFSQLASTVGIGSEEMTKWLDNGSDRWKKLVNAALNEAIQHPLKDGKDSDAKQMVRFLDGRASAFLSNAYGRIDMGPTVDWVRLLVDRVNLVPIHWDYQHGDMILKLVRPVDIDVSITSRMDNMFFGMELRNSMTGGASFDLGSFLYRLICTNGMRHTYASERVRRAHRGRRISTLGDSSLTDYESGVVEDVLNQASRTADTLTSDKFIDAQVLEIRKAQHNVYEPAPGAFTTALAENPGAIRGLSRALEVPQESASSILKRLFAEPSAGLDESRNITGWGLANAITAQAHGEKQGKADDLMALGGRVRGWSKDKLGSVMAGMFADAR